ncbi:hypothetical protein LTR37_020688 [Vermiconidia calcicola]|uniref:Uncharacterized protein n=1 Tax=Vermiconidia calcicola TaxID=1690605 RepID=A0ACC3MBT3_9PEZI|nr:hypothetical protein LTR37_020688 [Vermiconidia calcicola]
MGKPTTIDVAHIKTLSWTTSLTYNASSIITYNLAVGVSGTDLALCFEGHPSFHALPTFASLFVIDSMSAVTKSMPDLLPNFQPHNHVHGEHYLELKRQFPIPRPGEEVVLETRANVVDVVDRRTGVTVCVGITTVEKSTVVEICYNEWTSFIIGARGEGASSKAEDRGPMSKTYTSPTREPDLVLEHKTSAEQGALYRAASGDLNPLHFESEMAKRGGFEGPILTGTCTLGMGVKHVTDGFAGGDAARFKSVKVGLSKPVYPGETVRTEMWKEDNGRRILYRQLAGHRVVMKDGVVELRELRSNLRSSPNILNINTLE